MNCTMYYREVSRFNKTTSGFKVITVLIEAEMQVNEVLHNKWKVTKEVKYLFIWNYFVKSIKYFVIFKEVEIFFN